MKFGSQAGSHVAVYIHVQLIMLLLLWHAWQSSSGS